MSRWRRFSLMMTGLGLAVLCGVAETLALGLARRRAARFRGLVH